MNTLIVVVAQDLLWVLVVLAGAVWLRLDRGGRGQLAAEGLLGLVLVGAGIWLAGHLHTDPRPFVHDPASTPLFAHPADNGFPSDHSAAAGLLTVLVYQYRRLVGLAVAAGAGAIAWARVAAHVHHVQDVLAGLGIGLAAGALALYAMHLLALRLHRGRLPTGTAQPRRRAG